LFLTLNGNLIFGQQSITIEAALDSAIKNNLSTRNELLRAEYQKKLIKSGINIQQTAATAEVGQINSIYTDMRFGLSQGFSFPTVYSRQVDALSENYKIGVITAELKKKEIKMNVLQTFYAYLILLEKEKILLKADSNYTEFYNKTALKLEKGESNILEKVTAETQLNSIHNQLLLVQQEKEINLMYFQLLLNTDIQYFPIATSLKVPIISDIATIDFLQHPLLKIAQQQKSLSIANYKLEKSRLLPDINVGLFSMSMQGNGADNVFYNRSARFNSAQVGVGIPLFWGSNKSKINAARLEGNIADNSILQQTQTLQNQLKKFKIQFQSNTTIVNNFEEKGLANALLISKVANENFTNGEINYLDWVMLYNQAITIQNNYLEALKLLNESIISINYMSSKF